MITQKDEINVLSFIEQHYWTEGEPPELRDICNFFRFPVGKVQTILSTEKMERALEARGITPYSVEGGDKNGLLTPQQILLANQLLNTYDKASVRQHLENLGVSTTQYNAWLRDANFQKYMRMRAEKLFEDSDHEAYKGLLRSVQNGDLNAIKFFFELRGIYNPRLTLNVNVEAVLVKVVEIIGKHVHDPNILESIATEIEQMDAS